MAIIDLDTLFFTPPPHPKMEWWIAARYLGPVWPRVEPITPLA